MTDEQRTDAPPEDAVLRPPLARSADHRVVAGVCGGLGRYLDIDPVVFRVVVAVLCLTGGLGLFLYGLAWLIVPRESGRNELQRVLTGRVDGQSIGAVLLTMIGTGVFLSSMGDGGQLFPLLLLGGLVFMAVRHDPERRRARGAHRPFAPSADSPTENRDWRTWGRWFGEDLHAEWQARKAEMHAAMQATREQHAEARRAGAVPSDLPPLGPSGYLWDPRHPERNPYSMPTPPPQPWWQRTDLPEGDPLRKTAARTGRAAVQRRRPSSLGPVGLLLACGAGALAWVIASTAGYPAQLSTMLAAALLALGLTMLLGAKFGRARGLTVPALLLTFALAATAGSSTTLQGGFGDRTWAPTVVSDLQNEYALGAGQATLDLSGLTAADGAASTRVRVGAGDLRVRLPKDMNVKLRVHTSAGQVSLPNGERLAGTRNRRTLAMHSADGQPAKGTLDLDLTVGIGDIRVVEG